LAAHVAQPGPGTRGVLSIAALETICPASIKRPNLACLISSAWPRFHDIYQPAGVRNYWATWVIGAAIRFRETLTHA